MTTPTEELALSKGATVNSTGDVFSFSRNELQAFRSAVEAESDAERMKQPAVALMGSIGESRSVVLIDEHPVVDAWADAGFELTKLYAQPFPSTEQLQRLFMLATGYLVEGEIDQGEYEELMAMRKALANTQGDTK